MLPEAVLPAAPPDVAGLVWAGLAACSLRVA